MKKLLLLLIVSSVIGCSTTSNQVTSGRSPNIAAGDFVYYREKQTEGYGAYGYVLFTSKLSNINRDRYQKVSDAFLDTLPSVSFYNDFKKSQLMVTSWPLMVHMKTQDYNSKNILFVYDYVTSNTMLSSVGKVESLGPVLVAFTVPYYQWDKKKSYLVLDMSKFSDEEIQNAFQIWKDKITTSQSLWKNGLSLDVAKAIFRSLINKYGEAILKVYKA